MTSTPDNALKPLSPKRERFVNEYLIDLNATQAAIRAGYSLKTAKMQGSRLMTNDDVKAHVESMRAIVAEQFDITRDRVLREYARIAYSDPREVMAWDESGVQLKASDQLTDDQAAAVAEVGFSQTKDGVNMRLKLHNKQAALDSLTKIQGYFTDTTNVNIDNRVQIVVQRVEGRESLEAPASEDTGLHKINRPTEPQEGD